jgi:hypothetical protein
MTNCVDPRHDQVESPYLKAVLNCALAHPRSHPQPPSHHPILILRQLGNHGIDWPRPSQTPIYVG